MLSYKGFAPGLVCRGYQFVMGLNITDKANCRSNGFHSAENPLVCLSYYPHIHEAEYYVVDSGGDIDETGDDSIISCTELTIIKRLTLEDFFLHALAYMVDHPRMPDRSHVDSDNAVASNGYAVVRGIDPAACGAKGDILAFAKESSDGTKIQQVSLAWIDGDKIKPGKWYGADLVERKKSVL